MAYNEEERRVYERTARLILLMAVQNILPDAGVIIEHSIGNGVYITLKNEVLTATRVRRIEEKMHAIAEADLPIVRRRMSREEAMELFSQQGQEDTVRLLTYRPFNYFDIYTCDGYSEYFYGTMAKTTGEVRKFALSLYYPGMVLRLPDFLKEEEELVPAPLMESPKLMRTYAEAKHWGKILHCESVADVNGVIERGESRDFIRICEAIHNRAILEIAEQIVERNARVVFVSGPSSSGKTTFSNRLAVELKVRGRNPIPLSLDDYYLDRDKVPLGEDGKPDLECLESIDVPLFNEQLVDILAGETVETPIYSFYTKKREPKGKILKMGEQDVLIVEGIHGLNPSLSREIPGDLKFKVYVSALTPLNLDGHNRIRATDARLLRRMVRDFRTRGASIEDTMGMWEAVKRGEKKNIFPYQEEADVMFNTSLPYELFVLKKHAFALLSAVQESSPYFTVCQRLLKFLNYMLDMKEEDEIPPTSIFREFLGGCTFYSE